MERESESLQEYLRAAWIVETAQISVIRITNFILVIKLVNWTSVNLLTGQHI